MTRERRNRHGITLATTVLLVAIVMLSSVPADASWLARGTSVGGVGYSLKEIPGKATNALGDMVSAVIEDDREKFSDAEDRIDRLPKNLIVNAFPVLKGAESIGNAAKRRLASAKNRIQRFAGATGKSAGKVAADVRAALSIGRDERDWYEKEVKVMDSRPLPAVKSTGFVNSRLVPSGTEATGKETGSTLTDKAQNGGARIVYSKKVKWQGWLDEQQKGNKQSFKEWAVKQRNARPECFGVLDDETVANCAREKWGEGPRNSVTGSASNNSDWGFEKENQPVVPEATDRSLNEYQRELAKIRQVKTALESATSGEDYVAALNDLEARERKLEEQRRQAEEEEQYQMQVIQQNFFESQNSFVNQSGGSSYQGIERNKRSKSRSRSCRSCGQR